MKHGLHCVYYQTSAKQLGRYVDEFNFRLKDGNVKRHTLVRPVSLATASFGPHATYKVRS